MTLQEVTRTVTGLVAKLSGCSVVVSEDASLQTLAASRIAHSANRIVIPPFNEHGLLPDRIHDCSLEEAAARFAAFQSSDRPRGHGRGSRISCAK